MLIIAIQSIIMKQIMGWLFIMMIGSQTAQACDVCGCSGIGIGLLTDYKRNFVRLSYAYTGFEAAPQVGYRVADRFHQANLSVRYGIGEKIRLFADVPLQSNWRYSALEKHPQQQTGLGDAQILGYYVPYNRSLSAQNKFYWEIGGGFSFPTGAYDPNIHDRNLPENFNVGKGSMGYLFQTNAILTIRQLGIVANLKYRHNGPTPKGYRFGDNWSAQGTLFYEVPVKTIQLIPNINVVLEHMFGDAYANGKSVHGTDAVGCFISAAFNVKTTSWVAGIVASLPIFNHYGEGDIQATGRLSCQFSYLF